MAIWNVYLNGEHVHKPVTTERNITAGELEIGLDTAGSLELEVPVSHPLYSTIAALPLLGRDVWRVTRDGSEVFRGRTLSRERKPLDGSVAVTVEGELAMLNDSVLEPYEFSGSPYAYVKQLVTAHNKQVDSWKRFTVGNVTAYDSNGYIVRSSDSRVTTWEELSNKTVESSTGGHIVLRRGTRTIDWLASVSTPCSQPVKLGYNLLSMEDVADGTELVTAIRAVGADVDGVRIELASTRGAAGYTLTNGVLRNDALVATNGIIVREVVWDDVTTEAVLWKRALAYVKALALPRSVTVTAIDMSDAGYDVDAFDVGQLVALDALDTEGTMQVTGMHWDLLDPAGGSITFGSAQVTSSSRAASVSSTADAAAYIAGSASTASDVAALTESVSTLSDGVSTLSATAWQNLGTASTSGASFALSASGTWLLMTAHNSTTALNGLWILRPGGPKYFNLAGGGNVTVSVTSSSVTVTTSGGTVNVYACRMP